MDSDPRQLVSNALPLIAVVLMASGIFVKTLPLVSKRPADIDRAKISHAGRQDVEARLWQDPFVAMRGVEGKTPGKRCDEAIKDPAHHPSTLTNQIGWLQKRRKASISVLPVMVPGGPYFEEGEARRRTRYATVMALLKTGWVPSQEDKLGFVWTFESCEENPWRRSLPELLPYEWFSKKDQEGQEKWLFVLWVDEDAITHRPLSAMQKLTEFIRNGGVPCWWSDDKFWSKELVQRLTQKEKEKEKDKGPVCVEPKKTQEEIYETQRDRILLREPFGLVPREAGLDENESPKAKEKQAAIQVAPLKSPWERMPIIGPWTSTALFGLIGDLARDIIRNELPQNQNSESHDTPPSERFYSASATLPLKDDNLYLSAIKQACKWLPQGASCPEASELDKKLKKKLKNALAGRFVGLTSTDNQHTEALIGEIRLRLAKPTLSRLLPFLDDNKEKGASNNSKGDKEDLCKSTIVIVAEADTSYARDFQRQLTRQIEKTQEPEKCQVRVRQVSYLRGLDGAAPQGGGAPQTAAAESANSKLPPNEKWLEQAALERADGPSQYDYLRRLATHIEDLDRAERKAGRDGVRAIGVLGNDTYDKILVLDALRDRFPSAVFFTADLDARLLAAGANRSTRNLVVASGFGFKLRPGLQGPAPPFRDTYQTGVFLAVQVALDEKAHKLKTQNFKSWFNQPRLFEIGRTRPVNLIPAIPTEGKKKCDSSAGAKEEECSPLPANYPNGIHDDTDWRPFVPLPSFFSVAAFVGIALAAVALAYLLSNRARGALLPIHSAWVKRKSEKRASVVFSALLFAAFLGLYFIYYSIYRDVRSLEGEPFAWLEGVSIWPTQIIRLVILFLTVALLFYGRAQLRGNIDDLAKEFQLTSLADQAKTGLWERLNLKWLWERLKWLWKRLNLKWLWERLNLKWLWGV